ncbi:MAG: kelch motif-containing protein [Bacteroidetes bacterium]|nr:kelch motif-containing protein [Rhodothermia bacterium]MCS7154625.1 kelch motif-containing protein [Bacteroidota bacterium]MCX7906342.1 kelch motif-containing protein [Bacteroidota bacterium]MDW8137418.1 kelch repeat-containing protein [Bacteroidota bacterium]MDW8285628.1 kelch repeat-containing protein [Bacteroidota bacterium]
MKPRLWPYGPALLALGLYCDRPMVEVAPPQIHVLAPDPAEVIRTSEVELVVRATSFRPIAGLWANGQPLLYQEADRSWRGLIALRPGLNRILLEAADREGVRARDTLPLLRASLLVRRGSDMHGPRAFHTATVLPSGEVLLAGGFADMEEEALRTAERYDPRTGRSRPTAEPMRVGRAGHVALQLPDGRVLLMGGVRRYPPRTGADFVQEVELYDPQTDSFRLVPTSGYPVDRAFFDAVWYPHPSGPYVWTFGGWGDLSPASPTFLLGIRQDGRFYLFRNDSLLLYGASGSPLYLEPSFGHSLVAFRDRLYGLFNTAFYASGAASQNRLLDLSRVRTSPLTGFRRERTWHAAAELKDDLWLVAGGASLSGTAPRAFLGTLELFSFEVQRFYLYPEPLFLARAGLRATKLADARIMLSGGWSAYGVSRAVEWIALLP